MASTADFRNGLAIEMDSQIFRIVEFQHVKPGKGGAFVRTKLKNVKTGQVVDKRFNAGERITQADVREEKVQYLYQAGDTFHFMNSETFDQFELPKDMLDGQEVYLKEGLVITILTHSGNPISAEVPNFIEAGVSQTDPGVRGDTVSNVTKPATIETGAVVQVPLFINEGDVIKVDTRTGRYVERVSR